MPETLYLLFAFMAGLLLGSFFFGGLWWTVRKGLASPHPARLFIASYCVRIAVAAVGFYTVSAGLWPRMAACLLGFIIVRLYMTKFVNKIQSVTLPQEAGHGAEPR
jgi:F1F0 ATPase subunit 2